MTIGERIKEIRNKLGMSQVSFADKINVSKQTLYKYENNIITNIPSDKIEAIARIGNVTPAFVMGWTDNENKEVPSKAKKTNQPLRIPVYGKIPAGVPLEMIEDIEDWEEIPSAMASSGCTYFALRVIGNSMYPKYMTDDIVIVRAQPDCENGQDCVVRINGDSATLKKFVRHEGVIVLQPINDEYSPYIFTGDASEPTFEILGIVVELRRTMI